MDIGSKSILVVDDDVVSLTAIKQIIKGMYEISIAKSASIAWNILNSIHLDLILLDIEMPMMSGLDFITHIRNYPAFNHIPVIFVTSHGTPDILKKALVSGADGFVVKPVAGDILIGKIKAAIAKSVPSTPRDKLLQKLYFLGIACRVGKSMEAERIALEIKKTRYNVGTDTLIDTICKEIAQLNYPFAIEKIDELVKNNLYDSVRKN